MGIFSSKTKKTEEVKADKPVVAKATKVAKKVVAKKTTAPATASANPANDVILRPRITEKAAALSEKKVFTFEVSESATKKQIAQAIIAQYKVTPVKIATVRNSGKKLFRKGIVGFSAGVKKAYVYLKEGDTIDAI
ncbi:MAG: ribosomal subunit protein large subunit ribosomal protein [Candidatus Parcubacteria bacterium]|jgi:large subunit ribosomal protein L23